MSGISESDVYAIRRKSPFDLNRNPIKVLEEYGLSHKTINENAPKTLNVIKTILNNHKDEKGMIHTVSTTCKDYIVDNLNDSRLIEHNTQNCAEKLNDFKDSKDRWF